MARKTTPHTLGDEVRKLRRLQGLSQEFLAGRVGVDQSFISKIELGERVYLGGDVVPKLCAALGVPAGHFDRYLAAPAPAKAAGALPPPAWSPWAKVIGPDHDQVLVTLRMAEADDDAPNGSWYVDYAQPAPENDLVVMSRSSLVFHEPDAKRKAREAFDKITDAEAPRLASVLKRVALDFSTPPGDAE